MFNDAAPVTLSGIVSGQRLVLESDGQSRPHGKVFDDNEVFGEGSRHRSMLSVIARLRNAGLSDDRLLQAALTENDHRCTPPLPRKEVESLCKWGNKITAQDIARQKIPRIDHKPIHQPGKFYTWEELDTLEIPPPKWIVSNLLPEGLTLLVGAPKVGKSWLAQNAVMAVSRGDKLLGMFAANMGDALHIGLEDSLGRFQYRMRLMCRGQTKPRRAAFIREWPRIPEALEWLENWISNQDTPRLIVIDTLQRVRPHGSRIGENMYERDYNDAAELQGVAIRHGISLLCIHHERKAEGADKYDKISGSAGLAAAADCVWMLERKARDRGDEAAELFISGRDVPSATYDLKWLEHQGIWTCEGIKGVITSEIQGRILDCLRKCYPVSKSVSDVAKELKSTRKTVYHHLPLLQEQGVVGLAAGRSGQWIWIPADGEEKAKAEQTQEDTTGLFLEQI